MCKFWKLGFNLRSLLEREDGQDLVEYSLVLALTVVGAISIMRTLGVSIVGYFTSISTQL